VRFTVRDHRPVEFDTLWKIDQDCFAPGIAYSRYELKTYMRRTGAFTVVAEAVRDTEPGSRGLSGRKRWLPRGWGRTAVAVTGFVVVVPAALAMATAGLAPMPDWQCRRSGWSCGGQPCCALFLQTRGYNHYKPFRYYSSGVDALLLKDLVLPVEAAAGQDESCYSGRGGIGNSHEAARRMLPGCTIVPCAIGGSV
jgi:hypothetical protein